MPSTSSERIKVTAGISILFNFDSKIILSLQLVWQENDDQRSSTIEIYFNKTNTNLEARVSLQKLTALDEVEKKSITDTFDFEHQLFDERAESGLESSEDLIHALKIPYKPNDAYALNLYNNRDFGPHQTVIENLRKFFRLQEDVIILVKDPVRLGNDVSLINRDIQTSRTSNAVISWWPRRQIDVCVMRNVVGIS